MAIKENIKIIDKVQSVFAKAQTSGTTAKIHLEDLKKLGLKEDEKKMIFRNLKLKDDLLFSGGKVSINLINKNLDWDGNELKKHPELIRIVRDKIKHNENNISNGELSKLKITLPSSIKFGNINITRSAFGTGYNFHLISSKKDYQNKLLPIYINEKIVKTSLRGFNIDIKWYKENNEPALNKRMVAYLQEEFSEIKSEIAVEDKKTGGKLDIVFGDKEFILELKLARQLFKGKKLDDLIGQMDRYIEFGGFGSKKFMVVVIGTDDECDDPDYERLLKRCKKDNCHFHYVTVK